MKRKKIDNSITELSILKDEMSRKKRVLRTPLYACANLLVLLNLLYVSVDNGNGSDVNDVANA